MRRALPVALTAVVLAAFGTACSSKSSPPADIAASPTDQASANETPTEQASSPASSPTTLATAEDIPADHNDFGFIAGTVVHDGTTFLRFDRATFLTGDEANKEAAKRGWEVPVPNDYLIVNDNPKIREQPISADVKVFGSCALASCGPDLSPVTLQDFLAFVAVESGQSVPFRLHYNANGQVDRIEEQYVP